MDHLAHHVGILDVDGLAVLLDGALGTGIAEGFAELVGVGEDHRVGVVVEESDRLLVDAFRNDAQQQYVVYADERLDIFPLDVVFGDVDSRLLVIFRQCAYFRQRFGAVQFFGYLALHVGIVERCLLECLFCAAVTAERPYLDVVAELQRVGLFARTADEHGSLPFGLQMVAGKHGMVGLAGIVGTYELGIAEYVGRVVIANLIVDADQLQVELVFLLFLAFFVAIAVFFFVSDCSTIVRRFFGLGFGGYAVAAVGRDEDVLALSAVLDHCKAKVGLAVGTALTGRHLCHVDMAVLQFSQLRGVQYVLRLGQTLHAGDESRLLQGLVGCHQILTLVSAQHLLDDDIVAPRHC